jgi:YidC/Oxa1 family membrane protein insertase
MIFLYHEIIYRPILNLLVGLYNVIPGHDIGIVIILVTLLIRFALAPFMHKTLKSQKAISALQPKLAALKEKHKDDKEAQARATMELYREHNVNPLSSCLPVLIQLPILIALYQVFNKALNGNLDGLYSFVQNPGTINPLFLGVINLSKPAIVFALLAGAAQFYQSWMMQKQQAQSDDPTVKAIQVQTTYILPIISTAIAWRLPGGLPLYWIVTTLFAIAQQYYVMRQPGAEEVVAIN